MDRGFWGILTTTLPKNLLNFLGKVTINSTTGSLKNISISLSLYLILIVFLFFLNNLNFFYNLNYLKILLFFFFSIFLLNKGLIKLEKKKIIKFFRVYKKEIEKNEN